MSSIIDPISGLIGYVKHIKPYHVYIDSINVQYDKTDAVVTSFSELFKIDIEILPNTIKPESSLCVYQNSYGTTQWGSDAQISISTPLLNGSFYDLPPVGNNYVLIPTDVSSIFKKDDKVTIVLYYQPTSVEFDHTTDTPGRYSSEFTISNVEMVDTVNKYISNGILKDEVSCHTKITTIETIPVFVSTQLNPVAFIKPSSNLVTAIDAPYNFVISGKYVDKYYAGSQINIHKKTKVGIESNVVAEIYQSVVNNNNTNITISSQLDYDQILDTKSIYTISLLGHGWGSHTGEHTNYNSDVVMLNTTITETLNIEIT